MKGEGQTGLRMVMLIYIFPRCVEVCRAERRDGVRQPDKG